MRDALAALKKIEERIENALWELEVPGAWEDALAVYQESRRELEALMPAEDPGAHAAHQRVLAYCLMRLGNILRQLDRHEEAARLAEPELAAARASGDSITLGRSLLSRSVSAILAGGVEAGLEGLEEAHSLFESGDTADHEQGLGWYWILLADLRNGGLVPGGARAAIEAADHALTLLRPIENWTGVARAHAARARAHEALGHTEAAEQDRLQQAHYGHLAARGTGEADPRARDR